MYRILHDLDWNMDNQHTMLHILNTYKAVVEAIIPWTPKLAEEYGEIQYYGAIDALTYEYLILSLYETGGASLLKNTAEMLDIQAKELVYQGENKIPVNLNKGVVFSVLSPDDRLVVMERIRQQGEYTCIKSMKQNPNIIDVLIKFTMMGYYSEWFGYGSTRLKEPNQRIMEFQPFSWKQVDYPGPVSGK